MVENSKTLFECETICDQFNVMIGLQERVMVSHASSHIRWVSPNKIEDISNQFSDDIRKELDERISGGDNLQRFGDDHMKGKELEEDMTING